MHFETKAIHGGSHVDTATGAVATPIHLSTTFERDAQGETPRGYAYIRDGNPTQTQLERALAAIDSAEGALHFASGMAAGTTLLQCLEPGAHVILPDDSYIGFNQLGHELLPKWGLTVDFVAMEDLDAVRRAIRRETKVLWGESPSNPLLKVVDLAALAAIAKEQGALFVVDSTFATPALQRPIELGADVVLHSTTKYLGGHSDVQGGSLAFRENGALLQRVDHTRHLVGGVASPFNSWLVLRGIKTLAVRMRVHCANAMAVARFLEQHPRVEVVHYPGLESHPRHDVAKRQMSDFGGMVSFRVRGTRAETLAVAARVKLFTRATSLGGIESLLEHRQSSEGPGSPTPENLIRMSIGLEHPDDLITDLEQALTR
ncbi:MAG: Cystathionine gamma-synthase [Acidobacteria bacterium]|nr:Cystathionine gamma-synthase [Acidobacteriota bacterium]